MSFSSIVFIFLVLYEQKRYYLHHYGCRHHQPILKSVETITSIMWIMDFLVGNTCLSLSLFSSSYDGDFQMVHLKHQIALCEFVHAKELQR